MRARYIQPKNSLHFAESLAAQSPKDEYSLAELMPSVLQRVDKYDRAYARRYANHLQQCCPETRLGAVVRGEVGKRYIDETRCGNRQRVRSRARYAIANPASQQRTRNRRQA